MVTTHTKILTRIRFLFFLFTSLSCAHFILTDLSSRAFGHSRRTKIREPTPLFTQLPEARSTTPCECHFSTHTNNFSQSCPHRCDRVFGARFPVSLAFYISHFRLFDEFDSHSESTMKTHLRQGRRN